MTEFVGTLEKFTAKESLEHYTFDAAGTRKKPETRSFTYVVMLNRDARETLRWKNFGMEPRTRAIPGAYCLHRTRLSRCSFTLSWQATLNFVVKGSAIGRGAMHGKCISFSVKIARCRFGPTR
jgi:hypothetical protein